MAKQSIPPEEMQRFLLGRRIGELATKLEREIEPLADIQQFKTDFAELAFAIIEPGRRKAAKVRGTAGLPQLREAMSPRRIPFGPLRRMAKRIGPKALRYIMEVGSHQSQEFFRLELRPRKHKEFGGDNLYKRLGDDLDLIQFGHAVLTIERDTGVTRGEAYEIAAQAMKLEASSGRSFERYFQQFKSLCKRMGYVPHPLQFTGFSPCFSLDDLDGRTSDKS